MGPIKNKTNEISENKKIHNARELNINSILYVSPSKAKSILVRAFFSLKTKVLQAWNTIHTAFNGHHSKKIPVTNIKDLNIPIANNNEAINSIPVVNTSLRNEVPDDPHSLENAKEFLAYFEKNANWADISPVAVKYANDLVVKHADISEKEFNLKPELRSNVENAKKLIAQSNLNHKNKIENLSLGMADLTDELLKNLELELPFDVKNPKKELPSEVNKELSAREKYLNDWSDYVIQAFYPENYSDKDNPEIIQTKHEAKIFLDWKAKWSNIMFEGDETQKSEDPEGAKGVKNYYKEAFNIKNQMSIKELEACNRFIRKFDFILKNSSSEKRQEIENLELKKYVDDFLDFYNHEQIKILTEKKSAETKSAETIISSTSSEKSNNEKPIYFPGIIALQELTINDVQSLHAILAPDLDLSVFEVFMVDTKKYFESIATGIAPIENQKGAALTIAALWTKLTGNDQPATNTDEVSYFINQISQFFVKNPIAELKEFPNFEKLNTLFDLEKISNDFK